MNALQLQEYLHTHIPLSKAMQVEAVVVEPETVILAAPLAPNINHRETVFGGSAAAIATLAAWSLIHTRLVSAGLASRLVIQRSNMQYDAPIAGEFRARAFAPTEQTWDDFLRMLRKKGRARIVISAALEYEGQSVGRFEGEFVALDV